MTLADRIVVDLGLAGAGIYLHAVVVVPDQIIADQVAISDRDHDPGGDVAFVQAGVVDPAAADGVVIAVEAVAAFRFVDLDADAVDFPHFAVVDQVVAGVDVEAVVRLVPADVMDLEVNELVVIRLVRAGIGR